MVIDHLEIMLPNLLNGVALRNALILDCEVVRRQIEAFTVVADIGSGVSGRHLIGNF